MKKRIFRIIYIAIAVSSILSLVALTLNYLQFFPALSSLQATVDSQQIMRDSQNNPNQILVQLRISNPTGYSGLKLESTVVHLFFSANNNTIFQGFPLLAVNLSSSPLSPGGSFRLSAVFQLYGNQSIVLAGFLRNYGPSVVSNYTVDMHLFTFLDALAPSMVVVRGTQYHS